MEGALSGPVFRGAATRYLAAFLTTAVALLVRSALTPVLGNHLPFITLFAAVAFSAWFCGMGPSLLAVVVAVLGARYWFIPPVHTLSVPDMAESLGLVVFLFVSGVIVAFGQMIHKTHERLQDAREALEAEVHQRTMELNSANLRLRDLTGHVLHLQDEERRRIARELHDSAGQSLAVLAINLNRMETEAKTQLAALTKTAANAADSAALAKEIIADIRTISYLLHPPMLDEAGLGPALRWFIQGFTERSKIAIDLDLPDDFGRLSRDLETTIFRVIQECLTNILRHSDSTVGTVRLVRAATEVRLEVRDKGKGIESETLSQIAGSHTLGVGLRGMHERVRQLGGTLEINSDGAGKGTVVLALFPAAALAKLPLAVSDKPSIVVASDKPSIAREQTAGC